MACSTLTLGAISPECMNARGGIKDIWIIKSDEIASVTVDTSTGTVTDITTTGTVGAEKQFAHWQFRPETANATSTGTFDNAAGTYYIQTDLVLSFSKMDSVKRLQITAATLEYTNVVYLDSNGHLFYMGIDEPCYTSALTAQTGTAKADKNGYDITISTQEYELPRQVVMDKTDLAAIGIVY